MSYFKYEFLNRAKAYLKKYGDPLIPVKLLFWSLKFYLKRKTSRYLFIDKLNVCFLLWGGIGDKIISMQWIMTFIKEIKVKNKNISCILLIDNINQNSFINFDPSLFDAVKPRRFFEKYKFDVVLNTDNFISVIECDYSKLYKYLPDYVDKFKVAEKFTKDYIKFNEAQYFGQLMNLCVLKGWNRYDLLGACSLCCFNRDSLIVKKLEPAFITDTLCKFGLVSCKFITIHSGIGKISEYRTNAHLTRPIPDIMCSQICASVKQMFPHYCIVQLGDLSSNIIPEADICLIGKTSLQETEALLFASCAHIDNDSGLIHMRHILGKRNLVLWGPTDYRYVGYDCDINLHSKDCSPCMWFLNDLEVCCSKYSKPVCMISIPIADVLSGLSELLCAESKAVGGA